uniref:G-patch domain-containing protein n=1 Tax=Hanusia phi TaxID=3032 RepID=A0A7S0EIA3_9CRYP
MMGKMKSHSEIAASHNRDQYFDEDLSSSANFPPFGEKDSQIDISTSSKTCQTKSRAKENPNRQLKAQARSKKVSETNSTKQDDEEKLSRARSLQTSAEQENGRENEKVSNSSRSGRKRKLAPGLRDDSFEFGGKFIPMLTVAADEEMRNSELSRYLDVCSEFGSKLRESVKKLVYDQFVGSLKRCTSLKGCLAVLQGFMREIPMEHVKDQHEAIFEDWRKEFKLSHTPESLKSCLNAFIEEFVDLDEIMRENSRKRKKNTERKLAAQASVGDYSARSKETMEKEEKEKEENLREAVEAARHGNKPQDTLAESKGSDLLRKMGWKEGEGLGKSGTGTKDPVTVVMRAERAGLGSGGEVTLDHLVTEADSLAQANRKKAAARLAATTQEQDPSEWRASFQS